MKLEKGMYVRTNRGIIDKILLVEYAEEKRQEYPNHPSKSYWRDKIFLSKEGYWRTSQNIIKASYNIIDLIEVGDVITIKDDDDVYKILQIPSKEWDFEDFYLVKNYDGETEDIFVEYEEMKEYINSIVTKEQFKSVEYKVGE